MHYLQQTLNYEDVIECHGIHSFMSQGYAMFWLLPDNPAETDAEDLNHKMARVYFF